MNRNTFPCLLLTASFAVLGLACKAPNDDFDRELESVDEPVLIDAVELSQQLSEDPSTRVVVDLQAGEAGYILDQSEAPMPFEALLWSDGFTEGPVDFLTASTARGIDLDEPILSIRPFVDHEGFRQACGTFDGSQDDLYCTKDQWGWVCCSERPFAK